MRALLRNLLLLRRPADEGPAPEPSGIVNVSAPVIVGTPEVGQTLTVLSPGVWVERPQNTAPPSISGTPEVGATLTATPGTYV